jgi:hypothetical protein
LNELSVKINNLRADTNAPNSSINDNKIKKISDEVGEVNERVGEN